MRTDEMALVHTHTRLVRKSTDGPTTDEEMLC